MRNDPPVSEMQEIAASSAPLLERARALVHRLDRWLPTDAIWLTLSDPDANVYATVGSTGLEQSVLDYLDRPTVAREIQLAKLNQDRRPVSVTELPAAVDEWPTADCLIPAGFRDGLGVPLRERGGPYLGTLSLLFANGAPPTRAVRDSLHELAPLIARGVSPMRSLLATARLVDGATSGTVVLRDGASQDLPGFEDPQVIPDPVVSDIARQSLLTGHVYRSFLWPADRGRRPGHVRITVLAANDAPSYVLGTVLVTPTIDCKGLTPRELEVLGLLVAGCSNQQIARRLVVAPRTAAAHVEHILGKLDVPTRTQAAVLAERDGCYVPASAEPTRPAAATSVGSP